jgi:peptidoglycan hydrolase-like protein with peptidoglycan-binding domain
MGTKHKLLAVVAFVALVLPGVSLAQTQSVASLQAELQSLLAQVQVLEAQLAAQGGTSATWCHTFNSNLSIGMTGSDVAALQTALQKDGESITASGAFDDQTAAAVTGFQQKYASLVLAPSGLSNGTGYAGKATRSQLNALFGCTGSNPVTPPIVINPITPTSTPITPVTPITPAVAATTSLQINGSNGPLTVSSGAPLNLVWTSSGAVTACTISVNTVGAGPFTVAQGFSGNTTVNAPTVNATNQYAYAAYCPDSARSSVMSQVMVTVTPAPVSTAVAPYISSVGNPNGLILPGATVTVTGQNFDSNSFISIGNVPTGANSESIAVTSYTPTTLTFVVPSLIPNRWPLYVAEHNSNLVSNQSALVVDTQ